MPLPLVIHPDVERFLKEYSPPELAELIWKRLERLRERDFNSGSRVKKLQGHNIWEARISEASRLIFSYDRSVSPAGERTTYLAVQDVCLDHDDVNRSAKRARKFSVDSGWWYPEEDEWRGSLDRDLTDEEQNELFEEVDPELTFLENIPDELRGSIQWKVVDSVETWESFIHNQDADLPLKLSPEEYNLVQQQGNLLLSGSAGTGKTTVGIYRLLKDLQDYPLPVPRLYVAYNPLLASNAREQFERLYETLPLNFQRYRYLFEFKTIRDLCLEILNTQQKEVFSVCTLAVFRRFKPLATLLLWVMILRRCYASSENQSFDPGEEVDFVDFLAFDSRYQQPKYSSSLVWNEIRSILKGSQLSTESELLSLQKYLDFNKNMEGCLILSEQEKRQLYPIAQGYQNRLRETRQYDEIDLARQVLSCYKNGFHRQYHLIVCDEVQDLAKIQLELLVRSVSPDGSLFFAGDKNQVISPSGFRWPYLRDLLYQNYRESIQTELTYNFRNLRSLSILANQVLQVRSRLLNESVRKEPDANVDLASMARLVNADPSALKESLQSLNAGDAILVRTEADKKRIREEFNSTLIFTIEEAKGLEFDTVFLVNFFDLYRKVWDLALRHGRLVPNNPQHDRDRPRLELELNLLYVAITRARRCLYIWEKIPEQETPRLSFWHQSEVLEYRVPLEASLVAGERQSGDGNWLQQGEFYLNAGRYLQAEECFQKAGAELKYQEARAKRLRQEEKYSESAELFQELKFWAEAAKLWARIEDWRQAADCWREAGDLDRAAESYEKAGDWENAESCWQALPNLAKANVCAIRVLEQRQEWKEAARGWKELRRWDDERRCFEQAAKSLEERQEWEEAARRWKGLGRRDDERRCLEKAAEDHRQNQGWERAIELYTQLQQTRLAAEIAVEMGRQKMTDGQNQEALEALDRSIALDTAFLVKVKYIPTLTAKRFQPRERTLCI
ncbi:UvrD-helicase domain-containing protein [Pannus brasiliensis]|uniref:UvrD-helicase domain-containing protein n=1 Tax=Pannus brasiliensis TaxID=1579216 RepID=UPI002FCD6C0A